MSIKGSRDNYLRTLAGESMMKAARDNAAAGRAFTGLTYEPDFASDTALAGALICLKDWALANGLDFRKAVEEVYS